jgi:iron complex outermembrane receptor protein
VNSVIKSEKTTSGVKGLSRTKALATSAASGVLLWAGLACAQTPAAADQVEEIVVTATKTGATSLQKTSMAISAFTAGDLERSRIATVKDLVQFTPNLSVAQNNVFAQIYIRGIGSNNVFNGSDPSSTVQVDGVYIARPFSQFGSFLDVERVEVLRGPQGTLYGRNSVGGTINVISRAPTDTLSAKAEVIGGNYGLFSEQAYVSGPIIADKLVFSLSESYARHDPYRKNIVASGNDIDDQNQGSVRAQLLWRAAENVTATTRVDYASADYHPMGYAKLLKSYNAVTDTILGDYGKVALSGKGTGVMRNGGVAEDINVDLPGGMKLKSLTAARENVMKTFTDTDSTNINTTYSLTSEKQRQFSEELNLSGKIGQLDYVTGLYYFREKVTTYSIVQQLAAGTYTGIFPVSHDEAKAAYAQGSYHFTDRLTGTLGVRYSSEEKIFNGNVGAYRQATNLPVSKAPTVYVGDGRYHAFTPKFGLEYRFADNIFGYASATRGFKSGGFNQTSTTAVASKGFSPEKIWAYETGVKTDWLDRRLRLNLTAFHYDYKDLQVQNFITPGVTDISNAATAKIDGVELETVARPTHALTLMGNLSWLDARYDKFPGASGTGGVVIDASGNRLNASPEFQGSLSAQYDWSLPKGAGLSLRAEGSWQAREYFVASNDPAQSQKAYGLLNGSLAYDFPDGRTQISLWGKNLLDEEYVTATATISPVVSGRPGDPRTVGVRLGWKM